MSWYFFGGFSAYAIVPSARGGEPLGVLVDPRVVGRALQRQVERDLEAELLGARSTNASKSSIVPRSGWTASWPPSLEPIAHGGAGVVRAGGQRVVGALAVDLADRVDRRQVDRRRSPSSATASSRSAAVREGARRAPLRSSRRTSRPRSAGRTRTRSRRARAPGRRTAGSGPWLETRSRSGWSVQDARRPRGRCSAASRTGTGSLVSRPGLGGGASASAQRLSSFGGDALGRPLEHAGRPR